MPETIIKPKHGGARPGAGRHTADGARGVSNYQIMLLPRHVMQAKILGDGNISLGIRRAIDAYFDTGQAAIENRQENQSGGDNPGTSPGLTDLPGEVKNP